MLKTNLEKGINGDDADLLKRKNAFGSNTYPQKKGRSFWVSFIINLYLLIVVLLFIVLLNSFTVHFSFKRLFAIIYLTCLCSIIDVPLGSMARSYFDHIAGSCGGFFGAWHKDRGKPRLGIAWLRCCFRVYILEEVLGRVKKWVLGILEPFFLFHCWGCSIHLLL